MTLANDNAEPRRPEFQVVQGDSLDVLRQLPNDALDALVTDPPAGIGFMGKEWDSDKGGRVQWIEWLRSVLAEALRVLKPGAHGVIWAIPKTSHWTATAAEVAGFEIRDVITHHFGTGFPKSLDVSKAINAAAGAEREIVGVYRSPEGTSGRSDGSGVECMAGKGIGGLNPITAPATDAAKQWAGWGTALKPATEHWILVRKPLAVGGASATVAANVQAHGTGGLNIDACRIATGENLNGGAYTGDERKRDNYSSTDTDADASLTRLKRGIGEFEQPEGRWPANLVLSHTEWCEPLGTTTVKAAGGSIAVGTAAAEGARVNEVLGTDARPRGEWTAHGNGDGTETVTAWRCLPGCPVALLDAQSGTLKAGGKIAKGTRAAAAPRANKILGSDNRPRGEWPGHGDGDGGASRFFYVSKPSGKEREEGLAHLPKKTGGEMVERAEDSAGINNPRAGAGRTSKGRANFHPTVKAIGLMSWLVKLITPPGGVVLDPFCGSGTTGIAAVKYGCDFLGIEKDPDFVCISEARIAHALGAPTAAAAQEVSRGSLSEEQEQPKNKEKPEAGAERGAA